MVRVLAISVLTQAGSAAAYYQIIELLAGKLLRGY
jgi:hypothetical protein